MATGTAKKSSYKEPEVSKKNGIDSSKIKAGHILALVNYTEVLKTDGDRVVVQDLDNGNKFVIEGTDLLSKCLSSDQWEKEEKLNKTQLAEILISSHNCPMTVQFQKITGETRLMRCRFIKAETLLGRSYVQEIGLGLSFELKQIDHRTLEFIIVNNVKYVSKS